MEAEQVEAKHFKKGSYILIDEAPCIVRDNAISAPGKHGHAKCRITAVGIIDGKTRIVMRPGDGKLPSPKIDKREAQVVSIQGDVAQLMDVVSFEMFDSKIPEELKGKLVEGGNVEYWIIGAEIKALINAKGAE